MCARTDLWEPRGSNSPGPPGDFPWPKLVASGGETSTQASDRKSLILFSAS